jgi:glycosyltransferase involved in cell wall biosynthesis
LKIAFIDSKLNLKTGGGSNHSLHLLASKLVHFGHEVAVITLFPSMNAYPTDLPYPVIHEGLVTNRFDKKYRLAFQRAIHKHKNQFDIFLLWEPWLIQDAAIYRSLGGKTPIVTYLNNYSFCTNLSLIDPDCCKSCGLREQLQHWPSNPTKKALLLPFRTLEHCVDIFMLNHIDAFIAISPAVVDIYARHNIAREKMSIIPPVIDYGYLNKLRNDYIQKPDLARQYDILFVGRLTPEKGVDILIDAISRLELPLRLLVVGDGPHKKKLEQFSEKVGVSDRVIFYGWLPYEAVLDLYLNSQLFVHPARWPEPFGRTILDAMALRIPVIAADSGGPPWILQDAGLTFKTGDTEELAQKINLMYNDPDLTANLVTKAAERAKDFDYARTIPKFLDFCTTVIEAANRR